MILKKFFENKDDKTLKTGVTKGTDNTIKYFSLYILEKYRDKKIKTIGKEEISKILFLANLNYYKEKNKFLFDNDFMLIDGIYQFLDVYNLFCNIYGKNDIKDIEPTSEIIIDDVFEMKKETLKRYKKEFKIENEAKEIIDSVIMLYTNKDKETEVIRNISDNIFYATLLKTTKLFPVLKMQNLKEIMDQQII